jgi:hypothetical protein
MVNTIFVNIGLYRFILNVKSKDYIEFHLHDGKEGNGPIPS